MSNNSGNNQWWRPSNEKFLKKYAITIEKPAIKKEPGTLKGIREIKENDQKIISETSKKNSRGILNVIIVSMSWTFFPAILLATFSFSTFNFPNYYTTPQFLKITFVIVIWIICAFGWRKLEKLLDGN